MSRRLLSTLVAALLIAGAAQPAAAEHLVVSLSNHRVAITSSYTGEELVLFGTIERDNANVPRRGPYNIVVTVTGPAQTIRTRRKAHVLGIWINVDSRLFVQVPSYLAFLSNRPIADIAHPDVLRQMQIGLENYLLPQRIHGDIGDTSPDDPFRAAFVRLESQHGLYSDSVTAVTFLSPTVFRAAIPLPAEVPTGSYAVDVRLFADGQPIARANTALEIVKAGFEQYVATAARDHGLLYGLATAMMALLTGWFASIVFRRD